MFKFWEWFNWSDPPDKSSVQPPETRRAFHDAQAVQGWSTWFSYGGGWIGAAHSVEGGAGAPGFANEDASVVRPGGIDAALYDVTMPSAPRPPVKKERVTVYGFPGGSDALASRTGYVYMDRPGALEHVIVVFDKGVEPVAPGMSGGPVVADDGSILGVLVMQNSRADVDFNGTQENSCDMVPLSAVWDALQSSAPQSALQS